MVISSLSLADGIGGKVYKKVTAANFALYKEKKGTIKSSTWRGHINTILTPRGQEFE